MNIIHDFHSAAVR